MKDYTIENYEKFNFILNYDKKDKKIIINYADGKSLIKDYSIELEKFLLEKMKQQVLLSDSYYEKIQDKIKKNNTGIKTSIICSIFIAIIFILTNSMFFLSLTCEGLTIFCLVYRVLKKKYLTNIEKDIKKNKLFIQKEIEFKSNVNKEMGIYTNLKTNTNRLIKTLNKEKENPTWILDNITSFPTINDIDEFSYEAIRELDDLIKKNELLNVKKLVKNK